MLKVGAPVEHEGESGYLFGATEDGRWTARLENTKGRIRYVTLTPASGCATLDNSGGVYANESGGVSGRDPGADS